MVNDNKLPKLTHIQHLDHLICAEPCFDSLCSRIEIALHDPPLFCLVINATNNEISKVRHLGSCGALISLLLKGNRLKSVPKDLPPSLRTLGPPLLSFIIFLFHISQHEYHCSVVQQPDRGTFEFDLAQVPQDIELVAQSH